MPTYDVNDQRNGEAEGIILYIPPSKKNKEIKVDSENPTQQIGNGSRHSIISETSSRGHVRNSLLIIDEKAASLRASEQNKRDSEYRNDLALLPSSIKRKTNTKESENGNTMESTKDIDVEQDKKEEENKQSKKSEENVSSNDTTETIDEPEQTHPTTGHPRALKGHHEVLDKVLALPKCASADILESGEILALPKGWYARESKTHGGKCYFVDPYGRTQWIRPPLKTGIGYNWIHEIEVSFGYGRLGLNLKQIVGEPGVEFSDIQVHIHDIYKLPNGHASPAEIYNWGVKPEKRLQVGMRMTAMNDIPVTGYSYVDVLEKLSTVERPVRIKFADINKGIKGIKEEQKVEESEDEKNARIAKSKGQALRFAFLQVLVMKELHEQVWQVIWRGIKTRDMEMTQKVEIMQRQMSSLNGDKRSLELERQDLIKESSKLKEKLDFLSLQAAGVVVAPEIDRATELSERQTELMNEISKLSRENEGLVTEKSNMESILEDLQAQIAVYNDLLQDDEQDIDVFSDAFLGKVMDRGSIDSQANNARELLLHKVLRRHNQLDGQLEMEEMRLQAEEAKLQDLHMQMEHTFAAIQHEDNQINTTRPPEYHALEEKINMLVLTLKDTTETLSKAKATLQSPSMVEELRAQRAQIKDELVMYRKELENMERSYQDNNPNTALENDTSEVIDDYSDLLRWSSEVDVDVAPENRASESTRLQAKLAKLCAQYNELKSHFSGNEADKLQLQAALKRKAQLKSEIKIVQEEIFNLSLNKMQQVESAPPAVTIINKKTANEIRQAAREELSKQNEKQSKANSMSSINNGFTFNNVSENSVSVGQSSGVKPDAGVTSKQLYTKLTLEQRIEILRNAKPLYPTGTPISGEYNISLDASGLRDEAESSTASRNSSGVCIDLDYLIAKRDANTKQIQIQLAKLHDKLHDYTSLLTEASSMNDENRIKQIENQRQGLKTQIRVLQDQMNEITTTLLSENHSNLTGNSQYQEDIINTNADHEKTRSQNTITNDRKNSSRGQNNRVNKNAHEFWNSLPGTFPSGSNGNRRVGSTGNRRPNFQSSLSQRRQLVPQDIKPTNRLKRSNSTESIVSVSGQTTQVKGFTKKGSPIDMFLEQNRGPRRRRKSSSDTIIEAARDKEADARALEGKLKQYREELHATISEIARISKGVELGEGAPPTSKKMAKARELETAKKLRVLSAKRVRLKEKIKTVQDEFLWLTKHALVVPPSAIANKQNSQVLNDEYRNIADFSAPSQWSSQDQSDIPIQSIDRVAKTGRNVGFSKTGSPRVLKPDFMETAPANIQLSGHSNSLKPNTAHSSRGKADVYDFTSTSRGKATAYNFSSSNPQAKIDEYDFTATSRGKTNPYDFSSSNSRGRTDPSNITQSTSRNNTNGYNISLSNSRGKTDAYNFVPSSSQAKAAYDLSSSTSRGKADAYGFTSSALRGKADANDFTSSTSRGKADAYDFASSTSRGKADAYDFASSASRGNANGYEIKHNATPIIQETQSFIAPAEMNHSEIDLKQPISKPRAYVLLENQIAQLKEQLAETVSAMAKASKHGKVDLEQTLAMRRASLKDELKIASSQLRKMDRKLKEQNGGISLSTSTQNPATSESTLSSNTEPTKNQKPRLQNQPDVSEQQDSHAFKRTSESTKFNDLRQNYGTPPSNDTVASQSVSMPQATSTVSQNKYPTRRDSYTQPQNIKPNMLFTDRQDRASNNYYDKSNRGSYSSQSSMASSGESLRSTIDDLDPRSSVGGMSVQSHVLIPHQQHLGKEPLPTLSGFLIQFPTQSATKKHLFGMTLRGSHTRFCVLDPKTCCLLSYKRQHDKEAKSIINLAHPDVEIVYLKGSKKTTEFSICETEVQTKFDAKSHELAMQWIMTLEKTLEILKYRARMEKTNEIPKQRPGKVDQNTSLSGSRVLSGEKNRTKRTQDRKLKDCATLEF